jgi:hypothetical protein
VLDGISWLDRRDRARILMAPALLLAVLGLHVANRQSDDLSPWKGGGFGMFSTIDSPADRIVRMEVDVGTGMVPVAVPAPLEERRVALAAAPSAGRVGAFADEAADLTWVVPRFGSDQGPATGGDDGDLQRLALEALLAVAPATTIQAIAPEAFDPRIHQALDVQSVAVTVYRLEGDGIAVLEPTMLRSATVPTGGGSGG